MEVEEEYAINTPNGGRRKKKRWFEVSWQYSFKQALIFKTGDDVRQVGINLYKLIDKK
jgi:hypothetical protein